MAEPRTTSERIDSLPVLIYWLKQMQVDVIIDRVLKPPHGNWDGLSYGEVAVVFVAYVLSACTHFLSPMQAWARAHVQTLSQALGKPVRAADFSDDRLAILLSHLGDEAKVVFRLRSPARRLNKNWGNKSCVRTPCHATRRALI